MILSVTGKQNNAKNKGAHLSTTDNIAAPLNIMNLKGEYSI